MKKYFPLLLLLTWLANTCMAQTGPRFLSDIQTIKSYDKIYAPAKHPILFVGSSSIRKWDDLQVAFGAYHVMNRGIGGAVVADITQSLQDLVFDYNPRQIVLYVGENDVVSPDENVDTILCRTIDLYKAIRQKLPDVPIVYISLKPSPSRDKYMQKTKDANALISKVFSGEKNVVFVDIFPLMLKDGHSRPELFVSDMLHMNPQGYAIWEKAVQPYLLKYEQ